VGRASCGAALSVQQAQFLQVQGLHAQPRVAASLAAWVCNSVSVVIVWTSIVQRR